MSRQVKQDLTTVEQYAQAGDYDKFITQVDIYADKYKREMDERSDALTKVKTKM
jgi:hypothetical protein